MLRLLDTELKMIEIVFETESYNYQVIGKNEIPRHK